MKHLALLLVPLAAACTYANGYDPLHYAPAPSTSFDPEIEPLPPSPKRSIVDPRGTAVVKPAPVTPVVDPPDVPRDAPCGTARTNLCPMQAFMHSEMSTAHTAATLTTAFTLLAGMSPDDAWGWTAIATRGAELANAGNLVAAKAQCAACHDAYREKYLKQFRARAF